MTSRMPIAALIFVLLLGACTDSNKKAAEKANDFADVKVGLLITTGGKGGDLAGPSLGAANVAAAHLKADRDVKVEIEQADYQGDLTQAGALALELAKKVDALIVATEDGAVVPALSGIDKPIIHAYVTADGIISAPNIFRVAPSDELQATKLAEFLVKKRKLDSIGIAFENTDFGKSGSQVFESAVTSSGGQVVAISGFDTGGDLHTPVSLAADRGAEALVLWTDNPAEAARAAIDVHRSAYTYQLAIPGNTAVPQFGKNAVAQVVPTAFREGILSVGPWAGPWLNATRIRRFYRDFEKKQNDVAPVRAAQVYDAVMLLANAKGTSGDDLIAGLNAIEDFEGASVPVTFDGKREGMDPSDIWAWGFTKSKNGAGSEFFPAVDTGGGFFTLIPKGLVVPDRFKYLLS